MIKREKRNEIQMEIKRHIYIFQHLGIKLLCIINAVSIVISFIQIRILLLLLLLVIYLCLIWVLMKNGCARVYNNNKNFSVTEISF